MKKKIGILVIMGIFMGCVMSCGQETEKTENRSSEIHSETEESENKTDEEEIENTEKTKVITSEKELAEKYRFELDNKEYQLPCEISEFIDNGWMYPEEYQEVVMEGQTYADIELEKDEDSLSIRVINPGEESKDISECQVARIVVEEGMNASFRTGEGIEIGSTLDDVKKEYGIYENGYSEREGEISYKFYSSLKEYRRGDEFTVDLHIDGYNEQSMNTDELRFLIEESTGKINYISMEYYPA